MTREERAKYLNQLIIPDLFDNSQEACELRMKQETALRETIAELMQEPCENDVSAQVELEGDGYANGQIVYDWGKCPKCGWEFEEGDKDWEEPYCCHCGQRLHWFEDAGGEE